MAERIAANLGRAVRSPRGPSTVEREVLPGRRLTNDPKHVRVAVRDTADVSWISLNLQATAGRHTWPRVRRRADTDLMQP